MRPQARLKPRIAKHYQAQSDFVFIELNGLTAAGQLAMVGRRAHLHGLDLAKRVATLNKLVFRPRRRVRSIGNPSTFRMQVSWPLGGRQVRVKRHCWWQVSY